MFIRLAATNAVGRRIPYANSGHAPFIEEPDRFNHDLAAFVDAASAR